MAKKQIAIVGAGIAGLTAAYDLQQSGYQPIVFEKSGRVGGRMTTDQVNGMAIDCGAQFLMDSYPVLNSLIEKNGLSSKCVQTSQYLGTIREGNIHKTTRSNPFSLLTAGTLSFPGWLRFLSGSIPLMGQTGSLPANDYAAWTNYDDGDAETWCNAYFGQEVTDYILEPIFNGLFFQSLNEVSKALCLSMLSSFLYRKMKNTTALSGGIGQLPECLASQLDVRLNTPVNSLTMNQTGVDLDTAAGPIRADRVILAATAPVSRALYPQAGSIESELLATPYSSTLVIALAMQASFHQEKDMEEIYGFMVPEKERKIIATIANDRSKDPTSRSGRHVFVVFLSGEAGRQMIDWKEEEILPVIIEEMGKYIDGVSGKVEFTRIYRWKDAMPLSPVGRSKNVARYRASIGSSTKVYLAGDFMGMPFTEGAAETGKRAAEACIKSLG